MWMPIRSAHAMSLPLMGVVAQTSIPVLTTAFATITDTLHAAQIQCQPSPQVREEAISGDELRGGPTILTS